MTGGPEKDIKQIESIDSIGLSTINIIPVEIGKTQRIMIYV